MGYDPKQPRNENGEWSSGGPSGNNAGLDLGNRSVANQIKKDHAKADKKNRLN